MRLVHVAVPHVANKALQEWGNGGASAGKRGAGQKRGAQNLQWHVKYSLSVQGFFNQTTLAQVPRIVLCAIRSIGSVPLELGPGNSTTSRG